MLKRIATQFIVPALPVLGAVTLIAAASSAVRDISREKMTAYACEWRLLSDATCYPEPKGRSIFDDVAEQMAIERDLQKQLAPIIAEQKKIEASKREWDKGVEASDL